jgi:hypothetical protein
MERRIPFDRPFDKLRMYSGEPSQGAAFCNKEA